MDAILSNNLAPREQGVCNVCGSRQTEEYLRAPDRFFSRKTIYRLVRCPLCSLVWLSSPPGPDKIGEHYGPTYDSFIRKATEKDSDQHWNQTLSTIAKYKQGGSLLDLGCGAGSFLNAVRSPSWNLFGVEMSAHCASIARQRTGATVFTGDLLDADIVPSSLDVVTCFHVLEHVYSPAEVMSKVWTWLKPGGIFYVHVPNIAAAEAAVFRSYWYPLELPRHLYHFSPTSLRHLAKTLNFEEVQLVTSRVSFIEYSTRHFVGTLLRRLGISFPDLASAPTPGLGWRIFRKGLRLTVLPLLSAAISLAGQGQIVEAVFRKTLPNPNNTQS